MSPYSWDNYLNVLEAKITQLSSSPLVNAILTGAIGAFVILFVVSLFTGKS